MTLHIEIGRFKFRFEGGFRQAYIETAKHELWYDRESRYEAPNGRFRHWCWDRKKNSIAAL